MLLAWLIPVLLTGLPDVIGMVIGLLALRGVLATFFFSLFGLHRQMAKVKEDELALARALYAEGLLIQIPSGGMTTHAHVAESLNRVAFSATAHCLTGCAIGEVLGVVIGTALGWSNLPTIILAVVLAFFFGYSLTMLPLLRAGLVLTAVIPLAFASDTLSIAVMEIVDNAIILVIPGAMEAGLADILFWGSLVFSLIVAFAAAFPVNRWLIARGKGHAVIHAHHAH